MENIGELFMQAAAITVVVVGCAILLYRPIIKPLCKLVRFYWQQPIAPQEKKETGTNASTPTTPKSPLRLVEKHHL